MSDTDETPQELFARNLSIDMEWAGVLVAEGFTTLEEVAYVPIQELRSIAGVEEQQVEAWRARARHQLLLRAMGNGNDDDAVGSAMSISPRPISGGSGAIIDVAEDS